MCGEVVRRRVRVRTRVSHPGFWMDALPHSGESRKPPEKTVYSGAMSGTMPLGSCESTVSVEIFAQSREMSKE